MFDRRLEVAIARSPIELAEAMRRNLAAMRIAAGRTVSEATANVGYASASKLGRECGHRPRARRDA